MTTSLLISAALIISGYLLLLYVWWQFRKSNLLSCIPWIVLSTIVAYLCSSFVGFAKGSFPTTDPDKMIGHTVTYAVIFSFLIAGSASFLKCWMISANISFLLKGRIPKSPLLQSLSRQHSHQSIFGSCLTALTVIPTLIVIFLGILGYPVSIR